MFFWRFCFVIQFQSIDFTVKVTIIVFHLILNSHVFLSLCYSSFEMPTIVACCMCSLNHGDIFQGYQMTDNFKFQSNAVCDATQFSYSFYCRQCQKFMATVESKTEQFRKKMCTQSQKKLDVILTISTDDVNIFQGCLVDTVHVINGNLNEKKIRH